MALTFDPGGTSHFRWLSTLLVCVPRYSVFSGGPDRRSHWPGDGEPLHSGTHGHAGVLCRTASRHGRQTAALRGLPPEAPRNRGPAGGAVPWPRGHAAGSMGPPHRSRAQAGAFSRQRGRSAPASSAWIGADTPAQRRLPFVLGRGEGIPRPGRRGPLRSVSAAGARLVRPPGGKLAAPNRCAMAARMRHAAFAAPSRPGWCAAAPGMPQGSPAFVPPR